MSCACEDIFFYTRITIRVERIIHIRSYTVQSLICSLVRIFLVDNESSVCVQNSSIFYLFRNNFTSNFRYISAIVLCGVFKCICTCGIYLHNSFLSHSRVTVTSRGSSYPSMALTPSSGSNSSPTPTSRGSVGTPIIVGGSSVAQGSSLGQGSG